MNTHAPRPWTACRLVALVALVVASSAARAAEPTPSFAHDVMAVLSHAGCNMGACHGNQNGKGGFRLSLRGEDPASDYRALTREFAGRRVNMNRPELSLLLRKPTQALSHQGGRRLTVDSPSYDIIKRWIALGAANDLDHAAKVISLRVEPQDYIASPRNPVHLRAWAAMADGGQRDVTSLTVWETSNLLATVDARGLLQSSAQGETTVVARFLQHHAAATMAFVDPQTRSPDAPAPTLRPLDRIVQAKLLRVRADLPARCDDLTFLRRSFLDAIGLPPSGEEARRFMADRRPDRRERLIDSLLARPEFAEHWALKWCDILRNEEKVLDEKGVALFHGWIKRWLSEDRPLDEFVEQLVLGTGSTYEHPQANFYRALRDPATRGESVARLFLGARLQCAKCHNHPFDRWTQDDYYNWTTVFARLDYDILDNQRRDDLDKHEFNGEQIVVVKSEGEVENPRTGANATPKFLGQEAVVEGDRLLELSGWLIQQERFAEVLANWVWMHLNGRGLVDPVDDFRRTNPASHPELLRALGDALRREQFRLKPLVREVMNSLVYQSSIEATDSWAVLTGAEARRLEAEKLLDAQSQVLDSPARFNGQPAGARAGVMAGASRSGRKQGRPLDGDLFLAAFGKPQRLLACECERSNETTLSQALMLISGESLNRRISDRGNRLARWSASSRSNQQLIVDLYWEALSRPPTTDEQAAARELLRAGGRLEGLQDLAWALLNSKDFVFRH